MRRQGRLRLDFDRHLMLRFRDFAITSDAGLAAYRELDDTLALTIIASDVLADVRTRKNVRRLLCGLLSQSGVRASRRLRGLKDADRLRRGSAMHWMVGDRAIAGSAASASQMGPLRNRVADPTRNLSAFTELPANGSTRCGSSGGRGGAPCAISIRARAPLCGEQKGSAYFCSGQTTSDVSRAGLVQIVMVTL